MAKKFALKTDLLSRAKEQYQAGPEEIKSKIEISEQLRDLIRPLNEMEYNQLEENILAEGCKVPLVVYKESEERYLIVDGHNRYKICTEHGLPYSVEVMDFDGLEQVRQYMINNQLGRRNLTKQEMHYYIGLKYENQKQTGYKQQAEQGQTAKRIAEEHRTSVRSVERDALYARGLNKLLPDVRNKVLNGMIKIKKGDLEWLGKQEDTGEDLRFKDVKALLEQQKQAATPSNKPKQPQSSADKKVVDDVPNHNLDDIMLQIRIAIQQRDKQQFDKGMSDLALIGEMLFEP